MLKRLVCFIIPAVVLLSCISCSKGGISVKKSDIDSYFTQFMSVEEVLRSAEDIDLLKKMDIPSDFTKEVEEDKESSTKTIRYYDKDKNLVYTDYEGFGEDAFDYHFTSDDGADVTVKYIDDDQKRIGVYISYCYSNGIDYNIMYDGNIRKSGYGADSLTVTMSRQGQLLPESVTYNINTKNGKAVPEYARYFDKDGNYRTYFDDLSGGEILDEVLYGHSDSVAVSDIGSAQKVRCVFMELGRGERYCWSGDSEHPRWFVSTKMRVVFEDEASRDLFATGRDGEKGMHDGDQYPSWHGKVTLELTNCKDFGEFNNLSGLLDAEINDPRSYSITLDQSNCILSISRGSSIE